MTNNTATAAPATLYAQVDLTDTVEYNTDPVIFDIPDFRTDAPYSHEHWQKVIDSEVPSDLRKGSYEFNTYLMPVRDTEPGTVSFREQLALRYTGTLSFDANGAVSAFTMSERPEITMLEDYGFAISDEDFASWSSDLGEMLARFDAGTDPEVLVHDFLLAHGVPATVLA